MPAPTEQISVSEKNGVRVLRVERSQLIDFDVADELGNQMIRAVGDSPQPKVVVDLGQVSFLSSVGYAPFISLRAHVRKLDGQLVLANMSEMIREVFDATRLLINPSSPNSLFEYRQDVDDAVALLA